MIYFGKQWNTIFYELLKYKNSVHRLDIRFFQEIQWNYNDIFKLLSLEELMNFAFIQNLYQLLPMILLIETRWQIHFCISWEWWKNISIALWSFVCIVWIKLNNTFVQLFHSLKAVLCVTEWIPVNAGFLYLLENQN